MMPIKGPLLAVFVAVALFCGLYFGLSNVNTAQKSINTARTSKSVVTDEETLKHDAFDLLTPVQREELRAIAPQDMDSLPTELLKKLSGWWVNAGKPSVGGIYAVQVAEREATEAAWSVAGGTMHMGINNTSESEKARKYCGEAAKRSFEKAISIGPDNPEHRINLALVYADAPTEDNPMQAVLMLKDLETKYPDNPAVYNALGRLAIKTNQWEKALQRLEKAYSLAPKNKNTVCLLSLAYEGAGMLDKASQFADLCKAKR
jgi:Tetratricopeptide repeat